jgi:hypothetical protein
MISFLAPALVERVALPLGVCATARVEPPPPALARDRVSLDNIHQPEAGTRSYEEGHTTIRVPGRKL